MARIGVVRPAVAPLLVLLLIVASHGEPLFSVGAQDGGTPAADEIAVEDPVLEEVSPSPTETMMPDIPTEAPPNELQAE